MAMMSARAAIDARARLAKLVAKARSMTQHDLDKSERKALLDSLREHASTVYLTTVITAAEGEQPLFSYRRSQRVLSDHLETSTEANRPEELVVPELPRLPAERPPYISERHFAFLAKYFIGERHFEPAWFQSYLGPTPEELAALTTQGQVDVSDDLEVRGFIQSGTSSPRVTRCIQKTDDDDKRVEEGAEAAVSRGPDMPRRVHLFNEFVCISQVPNLRSVTKHVLFTSSTLCSGANCKRRI